MQSNRNTSVISLLVRRNRASKGKQDHSKRLFEGEIMRSIAQVRAVPVLLLKRRVLELEIPTSFRVSFSLVPFFWTSKRKILAVGAVNIVENNMRKCPWGAATDGLVINNLFSLSFCNYFFCIYYI